ncbi:hypothetical protein EV175_004612, partial [Coemansia sp. RSA 1933]
MSSTTPSKPAIRSNIADEAVDSAGITVQHDISAHRLFTKAEPVRKHKRISVEKASAKSKKTVAKASMLPKVQELDTMEKETILPDKFGQFGGLYVAEALYE